MKIKFFCLFLFPISLVGSGGYDHGTAAGLGNLDFSITWNPFNYFKQGQNYVVLGYGLTNRLDIHGYYSHTLERNDNYYGGFSYQFYQSKRFDLSTAIGLRKFVDNSITQLFLPQLLYTAHINEKLSLGGSFVDIRSQKSVKKLGTSIDVFIMYNIFENKKYKIDLTIGGFKPALWTPENSSWHGTYSLEIKFLNIK